ncbi:MAG: hypothetical protein MPF33_04310 [Candidatus Aramenus sp.]|nr:hypothetical protein [Candidatus Aramenus sp.]
MFYNAKSSPGLLFIVRFAEAFSQACNYSGGTFYLSTSSGYEQVITMYNGNLYIIDFYGFNPTEAQIAIFLDSAVA